MVLNEMWDMGELIDLSADIHEGMPQLPPPAFPAVEVPGAGPERTGEGTGICELFPGDYHARAGCNVS